MKFLHNPFSCFSPCQILSQIKMGKKQRNYLELYLVLSFYILKLLSFGNDRDANSIVPTRVMDPLARVSFTIK